MVELQPLPGDKLPEGLPDVGTVSGVGEEMVIRQVNCDLSKVSMFGFDRAEYRCDPDILRSEPKVQIFEPGRL